MTALRTLARRYCFAPRALCRCVPSIRPFMYAGHDLRQGVHAICLHVESLAPLKNSGDEVVSRAIEGIEESLRWLDALLLQVIEHASIDAGAMNPKFSVVDVAHLASSLVVEHAAAAEQAGVRLVALVRSGRFVRADELMLRRALSNLLDNAITFSRPGSTVALALRCAGEQWRLQVRDAGPGISVEAQQHVFREHVQLSGSDVRHHGGMGLGLAIAGRLVHLMQGDIAVRSCLGRGCVVTLTLAKAMPLPSATARAASCPPDPLFEHVREDESAYESMRPLSSTNTRSRNA